MGRVGKWQTVQMVQVIKRPVAQVIPVIKPRITQFLQVVERQAVQVVKRQLEKSGKKNANGVIIERQLQTLTRQEVIQNVRWQMMHGARLL